MPFLFGRLPLARASIRVGGAHRVAPTAWRPPPVALHVVLIVCIRMYGMGGLP
ncbi:MAG: hypothetical protein ACFB15_31230 [Cyclobacteriaceae bacterium]